VVATLQEAGLSQRAIASAVGVSQPTVANDIKAGDQNLSPPEPPKIIEGTCTENEVPPLVKKADAAGSALRKAIEKVSDVLTDEGYAEYRDQVKLSLGDAIEFAHDVLSKHDKW
jgi:predicted transcriptional regulator